MFMAFVRLLAVREELLSGSLDEEDSSEELEDEELLSGSLDEEEDPSEESEDEELLSDSLEEEEDSVFEVVVSPTDDEVSVLEVEVEASSDFDEDSSLEDPPPPPQEIKKTTVKTEVTNFQKWLFLMLYTFSLISIVSPFFLKYHL
jgi:hypothetical protein